MSVEPVRAHPWRVSPATAREIQTDLRKYVVVEPLPRLPRVVAGIDVSVRNGEARAAVVLLSLPELSPLEAATASRSATFPYVPGLLAFREGAVILDALEKLTTDPDVLIFDAHGLAHPRRFGLATHLGVLLDLPSVGCAKSRLCGDYAEPLETRGSWTHLHSERTGLPRRAEEAAGQPDVIGAVVRTRDGVRPVFVSVGHRADLASAVSLVLRCAPRYRLPETTRWAHRVAGGGSLPDRLARPKQGRP
jgi:deoxyribonuclease V